jgi:hypothetical protein
MKIARWIGLMFLAVTTVASGQRADCPVRDAPSQMSPAGKPPAFRPNVTFPATWEGKPGIETGVILPPQKDLLDAEEGHATAVARLAQVAKPARPPAEVLRELIDTTKTPLSQWRFHGYVPGMSPHRVSRVFSRDGSVLVLEQWNMAADGAAIVAAPPQTIRIGRLSANAGGLRTPSGCVSASLSWVEGQVSHSLRIVGPKSLQEQRDVLLDVARSIESLPTSSRPQ